MDGVVTLGPIMAIPDSTFSAVRFCSYQSINQSLFIYLYQVMKPMI